MSKRKKTRKYPPNLAALGPARLYTEYAAPDFLGNLHIVESVFHHGDCPTPDEMARTGNSAYKNCKREAKKIKEELKARYGINARHVQGDKSIFVHDDREGQVVLAIGASLLVDFASKKEARKIHSEMDFIPANWIV